MKLCFWAIIILVAISSRLVPHLENWTAIGALFLLAGYSLSRPVLRLGLPLGALILTDLVLGFHALSLVVYFSFFLYAVIGSFLHAQRPWLSVPVGAFFGAFAFFVITNFAHWMIDYSYPRSLEGVMAAYALGLPFFLKSLLGDLIYSGAFFATHYWLFERRAVLVKAR